jgi:hypothetical protein
MKVSAFAPRFVFCSVFALLLVHPLPAEDSVIPANFRRENLVAWCIVPFDAKKRDPQARAAMVKNLGLRRVAYDWREENIPEFDKEMLTYKEHGLEFFAFWNGHESAYPLFPKHGIKPQIWHTLQTGKGLSNSEKIASAVQSLIPLATRTKEAGLALGLYNHGGWGGLPDNLVAVCKSLREMGYADVGIVYNFHHAHPRIANFADDLRKMKPYLLCLNLNGMADPALEDVAKAGARVKPVGSGEMEAGMIAAILEENYDGPIGILGHVATRDVEDVLRENLEGLERLLRTLPRKP